MNWKKTSGLAVGLIATALHVSPALATSTASNILIVDDNNVPCPGATFRTIAAALARAEDGDEIDVCPGVYPEQVVITKMITLRGTPVGSQKVVIRSPALVDSRPSVTGGKLITGGILVDTKRVVLDSLVVDMSASNAVGCAPVVTGIYLRNASGVVNDVEEFGAQPATTPECDTGVGLLIESGQAGDVFGKPFFGRAVVSMFDSKFSDNHKGGVAVIGDRAIAKFRSSQAIGNPGSATVQNGIEISREAKGRLLDVSAKNFSTSVAGKTATGVLLFTPSKVRVRRGTLTDMQTGVFVVGDKARVLDTEIGDMTADGIVVLGKKNRVFRNLIDDSSVSGVFIDGDRNVVRSGHMSNMQVGVWFFAGNQNIDAGIDFADSVVERERVGGSRSLDANSVDPLTFDCATVADCDDGNPCTVESCNATTGTCSYTSLPDTTPCPDSTVCNGAETCVAGTCTAGTPLVCVDGNACTGNICDPVLGCQFPPLPDGTPCNAGLGSCTGGVCL
jgi:slime mold repeat-containing protein/copper-binding protein NosD